MNGWDLVFTVGPFVIMGVIAAWAVRRSRIAARSGGPL